MSIFLDTSSHIARREKLRVAVLGATGSIGTQTLDVCRRHPDRIEVVALSAFDSADSLVAFAREFNVSHVALGNEACVGLPILDELPKGCTCTFGDAAVAELALLPDVDCVMNSVVGATGISVGFNALRADKILCYANKESIVVGGDLLMPLARPGRLLPVDSEHNAIYQCMLGEKLEEVYCIWLTCSGGPFFGRTREELATVTVHDALSHPTWNMGPKITIDSSTLMNKGLEVIEAHHLFDMPYDKIEVVVQPQSAIHSMVEFSDGSVKAHLGTTDMRIPIQYALSYPERWDAPVEPLDFTKLGSLEFAEPDTETFKCLALARAAGMQGGTLPCVMNAANEIAVAAFLAGEGTYLGIAECVEAVMNMHDVQSVESIDQLLEIDTWAREQAKSNIR